MHTFRVWAPQAKSVVVNVGDQLISATRAENERGWWTADARLAPGVDYGFIVDDQGPWPDPRSAWQPNGVHGFSRVVSHAEFSWTDSSWRPPPLSSAIIYELHVGTFTPEGTFESIIARLDHLVALGVTHVELMPVNEFPGARGWGYDGVGLFAAHHAYGGPIALKKLVDACHARGLAVLLDVVYNHLGPSGNYLDRFGPYFTKRYETPWGPALNFDSPDSDEVRRFFCDNALMWLRDYHFDGLRLDAVQAILDTSAQPFLEQLAREVKQLEAQLGRQLVLIAETDANDPRFLYSPARGGFNLDAQWNDDFHHALHAVLTGEQNGYYADFGRIADLAKAFRQAFVYDGQYSVYRRRRHGRLPLGLSGHRFLAYAQTHDQVGNRAVGERTSQFLDPSRLKIAAALVFASPFVPMLFQGEEWGASTPFLYFTDHGDPELGKAVREGRRKEFAAFGWKPEEIPDPQAMETFKRSKLRWAEVANAPHAEMLEWHRRLIRLRREEPALCDGSLEAVQTRFEENERWFVFERGPISIACNLASRSQRLDLRSPNARMLLASDKAIQCSGTSLELPPDAIAIVKHVES